VADSRYKRAAEIQEAIREVLFLDWDPIGVHDYLRLKDEYDDCIGGVYRLLCGSPSEDEVIDHLVRIEGGFMGLDPAQRIRLRPVARRLLALDIRLSGKRDRPK
jgi:hypothetical protein